MFSLIHVIPNLYYKPNYVIIAILPTNQYYSDSVSYSPYLNYVFTSSSPLNVFSMTISPPPNSVQSIIFTISIWTNHPQFPTTISYKSYSQIQLSESYHSTY